MRYKLYISMSLILTLFVFSLVSCNQDSSDTPEITVRPMPSLMTTSEPTPTPEPIIPEEVIIKYYDYADRGDVNSGSLSEAIKEQLGIAIEIMHIKPELLAEGAEPVDGLLHLTSYEYTGLMKHKYSVFLPLNDYLEENEIYQTLPAAVKRTMKDDMGIIWGFPVEYDFSFPIRVYNSKVIEEVGFNVPGTIDEFTAYLEKAKSISEPGSVIMKTTPNSCLYSLTDVAEAFGLRTQKGSTVIYDKSSGKYIDSVYEADIPGLLGYISFLMENDYLTFEEERSTTGYEDAVSVSKGGLATRITSISRSGATTSYYSYGLSQNKRLFGEFIDTGMIFLGKGTKNPSAVINMYLDAFYGSNNGNILGSHGENGYRVEYTDDKYVLTLSLDYEQIVKDALEGKKLYSANLCGYGFYNDYFRSSEYLNEELLDIRQKTYAEYLDFRNKAFEDNIVDLLPIHKAHSDYDRVNNRDAMYTFTSVLADFMRGEVSINEFMDEYENLNKRTNQHGFIEKLNAD